MSESFLKDRIVLHCGDCRDVLARLEENSIDSCVTDPPYHLTSIVKRFGKSNLERDVYNLQLPNSKGGTVSPYMRAAAGFMGKQWDGGDIAFRPELWAQVYRILKPGAHLLAFGGTRTQHRMVCAIEDAGFEIRDTVLYLFGSGFPKSHDVSKGIDRAAVAEREVVGFSQGRSSPIHNGGQSVGVDDPITIPATPAARQWEGWGTALKPAAEMICLARKPLSEGTVAANVLKWGTGAINVDGCRVATNDQGTREHNGAVYTGVHDGYQRPNKSSYTHKTDWSMPTEGRWPANVIHDGSEEVVGAFPESDAGNNNPDLRRHDGGGVIYGVCDGGQPKVSHGDSGSAARFFYQTKYDIKCSLCNANIAENPSKTGSTLIGASARSDAADSPLPASAASDLQSSVHANNAENYSKECRPQNGGSAPLSVGHWPLEKIVHNVLNAADLCGLCAMVIARAIVEVRQGGQPDKYLTTLSIVTFKKTILSRSLASYVANRESTDTILTIPNLTTLFGSVFYAIGESTSSGNHEQRGSGAQSRLWYSSKADSDDRLGSKHPTVKPLDLMQYLVRLITPPKGTCLDCFAGTGTTGEAAFREGMSAVLIEREAEYQDDIRRRMKLIMSGPDERARESIKQRMNGKPVDNGPLFDFYNADKDFGDSINECYADIRERVAKGGPGWGGWPE